MQRRERDPLVMTTQTLERVSPGKKEPSKRPRSALPPAYSICAGATCGLATAAVCSEAQLRMDVFRSGKCLFWLSQCHLSSFHPNVVQIVMRVQWDDEIKRAPVKPQRMENIFSLCTSASAGTSAWKTHQPSVDTIQCTDSVCVCPLFSPTVSALAHNQKTLIDFHQQVLWQLRQERGRDKDRETQGERQCNGKEEER